MKTNSAFTLIETMVSIAVGMIGILGTVQGYIWSARTAELSGYHLAGSQVALSRLEQTRAAKWDPYAWPVKDQLQASNFPPVVQALDFPTGPTASSVMATSMVSIVDIPGTNYLRCITIECTWTFNSKVRTNTISSYRAG